MAKQQKWIRPLVVLLLLVGLVVVAVLLFRALQPPRHLRIAAGAKDGVYYAGAGQLGAALANKGYTSDVLVTEGSLDNIRLLKEGKADVALVQGGVASFTETTGLATAAMLGYEPFWFFYDRARFSEGFGEVGVEALTELRGKRIGVGAPGSGARLVALDLLKAVGITESNATFVEEGMTRSADMLRNGDLDAAVFVTAARNPLIHALAVDERLGLRASPEQQAVTRSFQYLSPVTLYRGMLDLQRAVPDKDIPLMAMRIGLIVRSDINADLVRLLLATLPGIPLLQAPSAVGQRFEFPNLMNPEIPAHPDAVQFFKDGQTPFERVLPFEIASPLSRFYLLLLPLLFLAIPAWSLIKNGYKWYMSSRVINWYPQINAIERNLGDYSLPQVEEKIAFLENLDGEISRKVKVSTGYLPAYFDLRSHIRYVMGRLQERRDVLRAQQQDMPGPAS